MQFDNETQRQLITEAVGGNADALSKLLERHAQALRQALSADNTWLSHLELADVIQVTYLEAFLHIRRFDPQRSDSFESWLLKIARNNLRDMQRELAAAKRPPPDKRVTLDFGQSCAVLIGTLTGASGTPSRAAAAKEARELLSRALEKLPENYRAVVQLYDLEGCPAVEVAEKLDRSVGAVYMLRARAHDRLRAILGTESKFFSRGA
ncbi:MAG: sigma-70 family RNA polymerase sigma factor [Planctomycetes bacterium]|nr:sigma-70 family RNA polymerase sigma factor [Planctomycetota bacterium]